MIIINADVMLAILLQKQESVQYADLYALRQRILSVFPNVYINNSCKDVEQALFYYPTFFVRGERCIKRGIHWNSEYVCETMLWNLYPCIKAFLDIKGNKESCKNCIKLKEHYETEWCPYELEKIVS